MIVNNRIEGTQNGFFFEISDGATVAGNVFVDNHNGVFVLNAANVKIYNNTFVNSSAEFRRDRRGDGDDHFGWHVTTGPGVEEREGHVFVNNLLVASPDYDRPLLEFEQPAELCDRLTKPMAATVDGNVYVRARSNGGGAAPLFQMSPARTENCIADATTLAEFRELAPAFEANGQTFDRSLRTVFKGPDVGRYELRAPIQGGSADLLSEPVRSLLGRSEDTAGTVGAFPSGR